MEKFFPLLFFCLLVSHGDGFTIPIIFGSLSFDKNADGTTAVNVHQNVNVLNNGVKRNTTFTVGNGTFVIADDANAIVNNTEYGGGAKFGVENGRVVADNKINANNKTTSFFSSLFGR